MKVYVMIIIALSLWIYSNGETVIGCRYYQRLDNNLIFFSLGDTDVKFSLKLNLTSEYNWLSSYQIKNYLKATSSIVNQSDVFIDNMTIKPIETQLLFSFDEKASQSALISFYLIDKYSSSFMSNNNGDGMLGLAFHINNNNQKHSLIHQYKKKGLIKHCSFSIISLNTLYLGGIPLEETINKYYSYCNVIGKRGHWNCELHQVLLQSPSKLFILPQKTIVTFITDKQTNLVSKDFWEYLINTLYKDEIQWGQLHLNNFNDKPILYSMMNNNHIFHNTTITFTIDRYSYTLNLKDFWDCSPFFCHLLLSSNPNTNEWVLGSKFYDWSIIHFDYEAHKIHFYSKKGTVNLSIKINLFAIKITLIINTIIILPGLVSLIIINCYIK